MRISFLDGERVYLRPLELADLKGRYPQWLNDAEVCRGNSHHVYPYTLEHARAYIGSSRPSATAIVLAIVARKERRHIGNVSLSDIHPIYRKAQFSILMGERDYWGQGYGLEASRLLLHHGFVALNLHRIECGTFSGNAGMENLAASLGMVQEGVRREAAFKDGRFVNISEYGVLRDEFERTLNQ